MCKETKRHEQVIQEQKIAQKAHKHPTIKKEEDLQ